MDLRPFFPDLWIGTIWHPFGYRPKQRPSDPNRLYKGRILYYARTTLPNKTACQAKDGERRFPSRIFLILISGELMEREPKLKSGGPMNKGTWAPFNDQP